MCFRHNVSTLERLLKNGALVSWFLSPCLLRCRLFVLFPEIIISVLTLKSILPKVVHTLFCANFSTKLFLSPRLWLTLSSMAGHGDNLMS